MAGHKATVWIELRKHFAARSLEWFNGFYLACWGAYVILHPHMMTTNPTRAVFEGLLEISPQEVWGLGAFIVGAIRLVALYINGRWHLTPLIRVATSFMSVAVWFWISVGLVRSGLPQTGLVIYPGLMLADMFSASRAASDAYEAEATRRMEAQLEKSSNVADIRRSR